MPNQIKILLPYVNCVKKHLYFFKKNLTIHHTSCFYFASERLQLHYKSHLPLQHIDVTCFSSSLWQGDLSQISSTIFCRLLGEGARDRLSSSVSIGGSRLYPLPY